MDIDYFLRKVDPRLFSTLDRALAILWWIGHGDPAVGMTAREICNVIERHGHPKQNVTRLNQRLSANRGTSKAGSGVWRLHPRKRAELDEAYADVINDRAQPNPSDSVVPRELFRGTRGYLERVVDQLNKSYDLGLYDCCAVMCRRMLETLLIETYEAAGRAAEIKGPDAHFMMFQGLLTYFENDSTFHASRNALAGLRDFKRLGDLSAHNRRFNARKPDIDRIRDGMRVASEELLNLSGLAPP